MKKSFAKMISVFLGCILLLGLMPFGAMALTYGTGSESDPYVVSDYAALQSLMANAPNDGTTCYIKLGADITSNDIQNDYCLTLTKKDQNVVLDLAGYSITRSSEITVDKSVIQAKNGVLTIIDSVGTGKVIAKGKIESAVAMYSTGLLDPDDGTIKIYGGTYYSESYNNDAVYNECAELYIFGGTFKATGHGYGIHAASGETYIYGGTFCAGEDEDSRSVYFGTDQNIMVYNLTAYGMVDSNSSQNNIWQYVHPTGKIYVDGVELTDKSKMDEIVGNVIEFKTTMLDKMEIFVYEPKDGNSIENNAWTSSTSNYSIVQEKGADVMAWFEYTEHDGNQFAEGVFEKNKTYCVRVYVQVDLPVMPHICAKVNGNDAIIEFKRESEEGSKFYWVEYTFPEIKAPVLPYADIEINAPKGGEIIKGGSIYSTDQYSVLADWHTAPSIDIDDGYGNLNGKAAPYSTTCYATIYINARGDYQFDSNTIVTINGKECEFQWVAGEKFPQYIMVLNYPFEITEGIPPSSDNSSDSTSSDNTSSDNTSSDNTSSDNTSSDNTSSDNTSSDNTSSEDTSSDNTSSEDTSSGDISSDGENTEDEEIMLGDINKNGKIDMTDYILLKRAYFGTYTFNEYQNKAGDINKNNKIDMTDYILLKRTYFGTYTLNNQ